jgi:recombinational DNA repair protein (RecF pathway)
MKGAKKLHEAQAEHRDSVALSPCLVCGTEIDKGYYGRHGDGGVCSKVCEDEFAKKPKFPGHSEEELLMRLAEDMDNDH